MSSRATESWYEAKGRVGLRNDRHAVSLPVEAWIASLLFATRFGWAPAGTSEPGGWFIDAATARFRVSPGSYVLYRGAHAEIAAPDALKLSLTISAALAGDAAMRGAVANPMLLGASTEQNEAALASANAGQVDRQTLIRIARLAWAGAFLIVPCGSVVTGFDVL